MLISTTIDSDEEEFSLPSDPSSSEDEEFDTSSEDEEFDTSSEDDEFVLPELPAKRAVVKGPKGTSSNLRRKVTTSNISKGSKGAAPKVSKQSSDRTSTRGSSGGGKDDDDDIRDFLVVKGNSNQVDAKSYSLEAKSEVLNQIVDRYMGYVVLKEGQTIIEARKIMETLVYGGLGVIDYDFGDQFIEQFDSLIKKGLLANIHENNHRRSKWFGSSFGNIGHNFSILRESPMMMTFIEQMFSSTGGVVVRFFGQYYLPSTGNTSHLNGHLGYHQDGFFTDYRLLTTLGDSPSGKKMTFSICNEKPTRANPGESVTINVPHGRTILLNKYVAGVKVDNVRSPIWHKVFNCEHTLTLTFEVFHPRRSC